MQSSEHFEPNHALLRTAASRRGCNRRVVFCDEAQQIVGPERRERVSIKRDRAKLLGKAPPGQLHR
jgi:hypothetical protein